jgi:hypothetical protein
MLLLLLTAAAMFILLHGASWHDEPSRAPAAPGNTSVQSTVDRYGTHL